MKTKIVDVKAIAPVTGVKGFVRGTRKNIELSTVDIWKCICARAEVYEHLNNGSLLRLNGHNYNTENNIEEKTPLVEPVTTVADQRPTEIINRVPEIPAVKNKEEKVVDETKPTDVVEEKSITDAINNAEDGDEIVLNAELATEDIPAVDATSANIVDTDSADDIVAEDATVAEETPVEAAPVVNPYSGKHKNKNRK